MVVVSHLVIPTETYAQMPAPRFKKAAEDTMFSTINPVVSTIGVKSFVSGLRVAKGGSAPGHISSSAYNNGMLKLSDTTFSTEEVVGSTVVSASAQNSVFIASVKDQILWDVSLMRKDHQDNILWSGILPSVSGNDIDQPLAMRPQGNNLFISGSCKSSDRTTSGFNAFVVKTDLNGSTVWTKFFEGIAATSVAPRPNGDVFVLVGSFDISFNVIQKVYLLDNNGNIIWNSLLPSGYAATAGCFDTETELFVVALRENVATNKLAFLTVDGTGFVSSVILTNQAGSIVMMEDSYAGFVVSGAYGGFGSNVFGAYAAEYDLGFSRLWVRKEANTITQSKVFTGLAKRHNGVGWVLSGNQARDFYPSQTYDLLVTSVSYPPILQSIVISGSSTICYGDSTVLSVPQNDSLTYTWKRYGHVVGGNTNTLTVTQAGKYKLTVTTCYGVTKNSADFFVSVNTGCRTKKAESSKEEDLRFELQIQELILFPNPALDKFWVNSINEIETIHVFDVTGSLIFRKGVKKGEGYDISTLKPGTYLVKVGNLSSLLVKQ